MIDQSVGIRYARYPTCVPCFSFHSGWDSGVPWDWIGLDGIVLLRFALFCRKGIHRKGSTERGFTERDSSGNGNGDVYGEFAEWMDAVDGGTKGGFKQTN